MKKNYQLLLAKIYGKSYHDLLVDRYSVQGKPMREIAGEFGISVGTLHRDIQEQGIQKKVKWK